MCMGSFRVLFGIAEDPLTKSPDLSAEAVIRSYETEIVAAEKPFRQGKVGMKA